jgi:hypothetical protein
MLLLLLFLVLVQLLLGAHTLHHFLDVYGGDIDLLLFGRERSLGRLEPLLFVLFFLGCFLGVFSDGTFVGVSEEDRLFLWGLIVDLSILILFHKYTINSLINPFGSCLLEIFFLTISIKIKDVLEKVVVYRFTLFLFGLLNLNIVSSELTREIRMKHLIID